ncbi:hypothetical protein EAF04_002343 [Stromatinia cepivora]|nr:hypothetical protein EAF04_002343 [Stromatinia cepivora]
MRPTINLAGFSGDYVPNFDITELYAPDDRQDFLVKGLTVFLPRDSSKPESITQDYNVVVMAKYDFTT